MISTWSNIEFLLLIEVELAIEELSISSCRLLTYIPRVLAWRRANARMKLLSVLHEVLSCVHGFPGRSESLRDFGIVHG